MTQHSGPVSHPVFSRRTALQAGSIGLLGLGLAELSALRGLASGDAAPPKKSVRSNSTGHGWSFFRPATLA